MSRMLRFLTIALLLLSSIAHSQDYELYSGISVHKDKDIKYGYVAGANFIINTNQNREYFNKLILGFEHSGYMGKEGVLEFNNNDDVVNCDTCDTSNIEFTSDYSSKYKKLVRAVSLNLGVELVKNWYLMSGVTNYQNINTIDRVKVSESRVMQINAGIKKFIKINNWIWSPTIMFNPNVTSISIGVSYKS